MMNQSSGWMNGFAGGELWVWMIGILFTVLLLVDIINRAKKRWRLVTAAMENCYTRETPRERSLEWRTESQMRVRPICHPEGVRS
jgi:hypothetical protein